MRGLIEWFRGGAGGADARDLLERASFPWHQRFQIAPGVYTPGRSDVEWLMSTAGVPEDLAGKSVLDVGAANGGAAFEAERRGAGRVVAVDIYPPEWFGFVELRDFLRSRAEFVQASVYGLSQLDESFDYVLFWGVLYHLRHPLLALDNLRAVTHGAAFVETAVSDHELPKLQNAPVARFYRRDELAGDGSNWFAPTVACLEDWFRSSGFEPTVLAAWPKQRPERCMVRVEPTEGEPEFVTLSYERELRAEPVRGPYVPGLDDAGEFRLRRFESPWYVPGLDDAGEFRLRRFQSPFLEGCPAARRPLPGRSVAIEFDGAVRAPERYWTGATMGETREDQSVPHDETLRLGDGV